MRNALCVLFILSCVAACAEDAYRDDFGSVTGWTAQRTWQSNTSAQAVVRTRDGIGLFGVPEPNRGMKWSLTLDEPADLDFAPWLVIRYRMFNCRPNVDYLLWLNDGGAKEGGINLIAGDLIKADGQWHVQAVRLADHKVVSPVSQLAVQCQTTAAGNGSLQIDFIALTDTPPKEAEAYEPEPPPSREWKIPLPETAPWQPEPSWLSNYTDTSRATVSAAGVQFTVPEAGKGCKWSHELKAPVEGATWVAMRYRARGLHSFHDYALYLASSGGGKAGEEQYALYQSDLTADGQWHVAIGPVTVPTIRVLAVQVQAQDDNASLEIAGLKFLNGKPQIQMSETFESTPGWPGDMRRFRPLTLPAGNCSGVELSTRLHRQGWLEGAKITVSGIPFALREGKDAVSMTSLKERDSLAVPLSGRASELYLVMGAQYPLADEPSYPGTGGLVRQVHRFVARLEYADGTEEEQFPFAVAAGQHLISRGLDVYSLALNPAKPLKAVTLADTMPRGAFGLVAATLDVQAGPATAATTLKPSAALPRERPIAARAAGIRRVGNTLAVDAWSGSVGLDLRQGIRVASLTNHSGVGLTSGFTPGPLFRLLGDGLDLNSEQFTLEEVSRQQAPQGQAWRIILTCERVQPAVRVTVWVDVQDPREIGWRAQVDTGGRDPLKTRFIFPEVKGLHFGRPASVWVWCPRRGDVITQGNISLREPYSGAGNPFQVIGAFDPAAGTGMYLMTQDLEAVSRFYHVQKANEGARLGVEWDQLTQDMLPRVVWGFNQGDWHEQMQRYQEWATTWYRPAAPRKDWFRSIFSFRQQFLHHGLPSASGMFDPQTKTFRIKEVYDADDRAFGGLDYLHLFDWGWDPVHGRCGDYLPWDYLGGVENFRRAVAEVQQAGTPVGLYIEGILVEPTSLIGKAHGQQWQMLDAALKPYPHFAPSLNMCSHVTAWQDYLSNTYDRVQRETGARGYYIDEYGFESYSRSCYSPAHGHRIPATPVRGERQMLQKVRQKLGPETAIYTEESPTDVNSQFQDGSFTYNISSVTDAWSPTHLNLYRFAFPEFKTIEIITCDRPLGTNVEAVKRILFNGEAIWIEGDWDKWFSKPVRDQIALNHKVMRDNRQCFTSRHVKPLVPTLLQGLYANQFPERDDLIGKTCWTVYNTHYRTVRAEVIAVEHAPGCQYLDELTGRPLTTRIVGKTAYLTLELGPRDVAVISRGLYLK